jgi:hypothetical protein
MQMYGPASKVKYMRTRRDEALAYFPSPKEASEALNLLLGPSALPLDDVDGGRKLKAQMWFEQKDHNRKRRRYPLQPSSHVAP